MAEDIKDEIVLNDDELICVLTGNKKKSKRKRTDASINNSSNE